MFRDQCRCTLFVAKESIMVVGCWSTQSFFCEWSSSADKAMHIANTGFSCDLAGVARQRLAYQVCMLCLEMLCLEVAKVKKFDQICAPTRSIERLGNTIRCGRTQCDVRHGDG